MSSKLVALVTGASSGIGLASAEQLALAGFTVYGTSRRPPRHNGHHGFRFLTLDVCHDASVKACIRRVLADAGRIDLLVNNAGIAIEGAVEETSLDEIKSVFDTNFFGTVRMIRAVLPTMRSQRSGRIINIGSVAGFIPMPYSAAYSASKHAIHGFSESLDHEVRNFGIRVSVVEPGFIRTDIVDHSPVAAAAFEPYISARSKPSSIFREQIANGVDPNVVARTVVEAATSDFPRVAYLPDGIASLASLLRTVVPTPLFDFALRRRMHIDDQ